MTFQYLRCTLNSKTVTKYYDFSWQSGYKPSRMQTGKQHHVVERFTLAVWYKEEPVGDVELNTNER